MKTRMIVSALLIMLLSTGIHSKAEAAPWRHGYGWGRPVVRIAAPRVGVCLPPVVAVGGYYGGYYPGPGYYRGYYAGPRYYGGYGPHYGGYAPHYYARGGYGRGYNHGYRGRR
jgi:hypothetical protein